MKLTSKTIEFDGVPAATNFEFQPFPVLLCYSALISILNITENGTKQYSFYFIVEIIVVKKCNIKHTFLKRKPLSQLHTVKVTVVREDSRQERQLFSAVTVPGVSQKSLFMRVLPAVQTILPSLFFQRTVDKISWQHKKSTLVLLDLVRDQFRMYRTIVP